MKDRFYFDFACDKLDQAAFTEAVLREICVLLTSSELEH